MLKRSRGTVYTETPRRLILTLPAAKKRQCISSQRGPEYSSGNREAALRSMRQRKASAAEDAGTMAAHIFRDRHCGRAPPDGGSCTAYAGGATRAPSHVPVPCPARAEFNGPQWQRSQPSKHSSGTSAPAEERPCKRRHTEAATVHVPDARLSGRGWHERWPPPACASRGHVHLGSR